MTVKNRLSAWSSALLGAAVLIVCCTGCGGKTGAAPFPEELVHFEAGTDNPLFSGTGDSTDWDEKIRERGFILREDSTYYLWYTGYNRQTGKQMKYLGLATSPDGLKWERYGAGPIYREHWIEDMCVVKSGDTYYMFAEGRDDIPRIFSSPDRVTWTDQGVIDIRLKDGSPIPKGPYGTPAAWIEGDTWYLFYERNDENIWLATSGDRKTWTNVQDEPVLYAGPEAYDKYAVAFNQVIRHNGYYYAYYHASAYEDWREWTTNVAVSKDLVHWTKYSGNPILRDNKSSGHLVHDGTRYRLYTSHPEVHVHFPVRKQAN